MLEELIERSVVVVEQAEMLTMLADLQARCIQEKVLARSSFELIQVQLGELMAG